MSLTYRVYSNGGGGGPVDLSSPVAVTASLSCDVGPLAAPGDFTFLVRAFDTATGFEDMNLDATARLVLDGSGDDVTGRPASPVNLIAAATRGGSARVEWAFFPGGGGTPTGFKVWAQVGAIDYALTPGLTVAYSPGRPAWSATLPGLTDGATYTIAVRATNGVADDPNTDTATVVADATAPLPVRNLASVATY